MELTKLECPNCGAKELLPDERGYLICAFCESTFGEAARICPDCGYYNDASVRFCGQCGDPLIRDCPVCGADNWVLAAHCVQCGRGLDQIEKMTRRWQQTAQQRLQEWKVEVGHIKAQEEEASRQRMEALMQVERARREALAQAQAIRLKHDQQLMLLLVMAIVAVVLAMMFVFFLTSLGR